MIIWLYWWILCWIFFSSHSYQFIIIFIHSNRIIQSMILNNNLFLFILLSFLYQLSICWININIFYTILFQCFLFILFDESLFILLNKNDKRIMNDEYFWECWYLILKWIVLRMLIWMKWNKELFDIIINIIFVDCYWLNGNE